MQRTDITAVFPDATAEQINTIMNLNGADINKAKGDLDELKNQLATTKAELDGLKSAGHETALNEAKETISNLQHELDGLKQADTIRQMREKVASDTKVPASLLTGETEEACAAQAQAIMDFAANNSNGYPVVKDGGEAAKVQPGHIESAWQTLMAQINNQ